MSPNRRSWEGPFPAPRPRKVDGGLRARSTRGAIGDTWWSRRFLIALESLAIGGRLTRGKTYARAGQVITLELAVGEVRASVQGSRPRPYQVRIGLAPFPELVWARVEVALAEQAIYSARLLASEMPPDLDEVFAAAGAPLFPQRADELEMSCSCPDWEVPCKHLAATFYLLAERFDEDPFEILAWRGRDRAALITRLRALRDLTPVAPAESTADRHQTGLPGPLIGAGALLAALPQAAADDAAAAASPDRFWLPPFPLPAQPPVVHVGADLLLRQLPEPDPAIGGASLVAALQVAYHQLAAAPD